MGDDPGSKRRIALGIEDHLDEFARSNSADSWKRFARADPLQWRFFFLEVMDVQDVEIVFNLDGVRVWEGVARASRGGQGATDWELMQIMQNKQWWPRIKWIKNGIRFSNPFE